jgi:GH35 family endo-1,4-beta-xylanase
VEAESGGSISSLTRGFTAGVNQACVSGTLADGERSSGLLGMNVDQAEGSDVKKVWTGEGEYVGVQVHIAKNRDTVLRLELTAADGSEYCAEIPSGESSLLWGEFSTACWGDAGTQYDPSIGFTSINLRAPGDDSGEVSFDYCLKDLYPIPNTAAQDPAKKWVGNITQNGQIASGFLQMWSQITPENEGKWGSMEPSRDHMSWSEVDAIYKFAKDNGIPFKQHTFVWGSQQPSWIDSVPQDEQDDEVEEWIAAFCDRYPDVDMIDVVNEPDHAPPSFLDALGGRGVTGYDWIIWSFEKARQYCPGAKLILNDYNVLRWHTDNFIEIAKIVASRGLLDGIGCQAHGLESQSVSELKTNLDRVASVGVPIYISEYDINLSDDSQQRDVMEQQFVVFYEHPSVLGITLWGYVQGAHWRPDAHLQRHDGTPRPALTWLMDYLGQ